MASKKAPAKKAPAKKPTLLERMQASNPVVRAKLKTQQARNARIDEATGIAEERRALAAKKKKR